MKRLMALFICLVAVILPWRLRVLFAESIGWIAQAAHWLPYVIIRFIVKKLKKEQPVDE